MLIRKRLSFMRLRIMKKQLKSVLKLLIRNGPKNYENAKFKITIEGRIKPDSSTLHNQNKTDASSSGMEETSSLKTFFLFTLRSNISEPSEQSSESSSVTSLVQGTKYEFHDDNGENS
ncbi:hypothetical protein TNCV_5108411 [Trichonephila clavipes]|nr:hypothetical protein TNCV_5108411 [Trichonephila clavipes]